MNVFTMQGERNRTHEREREREKLLYRISSDSDWRSETVYKCARLACDTFGTEKMLMRLVYVRIYVKTRRCFLDNELLLRAA